MLGIFFMLFCHMLIIFKINFFNQFFLEYRHIDKQFVSSLGLIYCQDSSGPKCLQSLIPADHSGSQRASQFDKDCPQKTILKS